MVALPISRNRRKPWVCVAFFTPRPLNPGGQSSARPFPACVLCERSENLCLFAAAPIYPPGIRQPPGTFRALLDLRCLPLPVMICIPTSLVRRVSLEAWHGISMGICPSHMPRLLSCTVALDRDRCHQMSTSTWKSSRISHKSSPHPPRNRPAPALPRMTHRRRSSDQGNRPIGEHGRRFSAHQGHLLGTILRRDACHVKTDKARRYASESR